MRVFLSIVFFMSFISRSLPAVPVLYFQYSPFFEVIYYTLELFSLSDPFLTTDGQPIPEKASFIVVASVASYFLTSPRPLETVSHSEW